MANILILGGGFGGLMLAERLSDLFGNSEHRITLVSPKDKFTFYPALVRLAFGDCSEDDISSHGGVASSSRGVKHRGGNQW